MTTVAIHQPNYLPWLGYFSKIAQAGIFVFLDDVQYSKNSLTNRVQVHNGKAATWLTVPVQFRFGDSISAVRPAAPDWQSSHLERLQAYYRGMPCFKETWHDVEHMLTEAAGADIAAINRGLVVAMAGHLGLATRFVDSSKLDSAGLAGDDRLVHIVSQLAPGGIYLSGRGGAKYQDSQKFTDAGLQLVYTDFEHPRYEQGTETFIAGLSALDAVFRLGWSATARLLVR